MARGPVDGFGPDVEEKLKRRRKANGAISVEDLWKDVYLVLFPAERFTPSPCKNMSSPIPCSL